MRILVVEDDRLLARRMAREILDMGDEVIGPFAGANEAMPCPGQVDAAILGMKPGEAHSFRIADSLRERGIPFLFLTGHDPHPVPSRFRNEKVYSKPGPAWILLRDLRHRHAIRLARSASVTIEEVVREMLAKAQRVMRERAPAERLVEAVLKTAIKAPRHAETGEEMRCWLFRLLEEELKLRRRHFH